MCLLAFGIRKDVQRKGLGSALFLDSLVPWAVKWGTAAAEGDQAAAGVLLVESALQRDAPFNFWSHLLGHKLGCAITECSTDAELREWVAKAKLPGEGIRGEGRPWTAIYSEAPTEAHCGAIPSAYLDLGKSGGGGAAASSCASGAAAHWLARLS